MDNREINEYNRCHQVAQEIANAIEGEEVDIDTMIEILSEIQHTDTLFSNLSSEDKFRQSHELLNKAYENREQEKLLSRIDVAWRRQKMRVRRLSVGVSSIAASMIAIYFYLFSDLKQEANLIGENVKIVAPTLIVEDQVIILGDNKDTVKAVDYVKSKEVAQQKKETVSNKINMQRLIVPSGFTYSVVLSDGSQVTLSAGSELLYPSDFESSTRSVTLKGEAFFYVTKSDVPFIVNYNDSFIKVYGTNFNVNGQDSTKLVVVLVEGSVGVGSKEVKEVIIKPNQKIELNKINGEALVSEVDPNDYLGWKNGLFMYNNTDFNTLIGEIARWYNVSFDYDMTIFENIKVNISLSRDSSKEDIFSFIENVAKVKFIKERSGRYNIIAD